MQTAFTPEFLASADGREADSILRSCVHCGFCTATCPTFLDTGNELDSPRGRIYLIKSMLEGERVSALTQTHLDRCLACQSCESTCPSGVDYHSLLNIGRRAAASKLSRPLRWRLKSWLLRRGLTTRWMRSTGIYLGRVFRFLLPTATVATLTRPRGDVRWPVAGHEGQRRMLVLDGCVQQAFTPETNAAAARVFARLGIILEQEPREGCCGAMAYHLDNQTEGLAKARRKIDLLCRKLDEGVEAIISTASGCGNFIEQYRELFRQDKVYAARAARVADATMDIARVLASTDLSRLKPRQGHKVAFHCPCTLRHGLGQAAQTEALLAKLGFELAEVSNGHLCCGSAGAWSVMQPEMSSRLRARKLSDLKASEPDAIVTANIGCQLHLESHAGIPVTHWITLLDSMLE